MLRMSRCCLVSCLCLVLLISLSHFPSQVVSQGRNVLISPASTSDAIAKTDLSPELYRFVFWVTGLLLGIWVIKTFIKIKYILQIYSALKTDNVVRLEGLHARFPQSLSREMLYGMIRNRVVHEEKAVQKLIVPAHVLTHGAKLLPPSSTPSSPSIPSFPDAYNLRFPFCSAVPVQIEVYLGVPLRVIQSVYYTDRKAWKTRKAPLDRRTLRKSTDISEVELATLNKTADGHELTNGKTNGHKSPLFDDHGGAVLGATGHAVDDRKEQNGSNQDSTTKNKKKSHTLTPLRTLKVEDTSNVFLPGEYQHLLNPVIFEPIAKPRWVCIPIPTALLNSVILDRSSLPIVVVVSTAKESFLDEKNRKLLKDHISSAQIQELTLLSYNPPAQGQATHILPAPSNAPVEEAKAVEEVDPNADEFIDETPNGTEGEGADKKKQAGAASPAKPSNVITVASSSQIASHFKFERQLILTPDSILELEELFGLVTKGIKSLGIPSPNASTTQEPSITSFSGSVAGSDDSTECIACLSDVKDVILLPCKHVCLCQGCFASVTKCPVCRSPIVSHMKFMDPVAIQKGNALHA